MRLLKPRRDLILGNRKGLILGSSPDRGSRPVVRVPLGVSDGMYWKFFVPTEMLPKSTLATVKLRLRSA
jgi:hypothetical protein